MKIADIYAGKPDASDEIRERGYEEFAKNYIKPSGVDVDSLASVKYGTPFFILGDKGTGKTALLHFLEDYVRQVDPSACSSFISFERSFSQPQRVIFNAISASITIDKSIATIGENAECDYSYIWKWQLYQKIITDNDDFNGGLFESDSNWHSFVSEIGKVQKTINKGSMLIPATISLSAPANVQSGTVTPEMKIEPLDLSNRSFDKTKSYNEFVKIIDKADNLVRTIKRRDVPYYIFIDELEAYRGNNDTFFRDLRMIRDLLFLVKYLNDLFGTGTKIICSVRLEIINAINRFIEPKQLHKIMQGYDERLVWEYSNTNSFKHPIIGILIRRIKSAVEEKDGYTPTDEQIIKQWFVPMVNRTHICKYILDNSWHKPRDIVRLLLSAQGRHSKGFDKFDQKAFDTFMPVYSRQCLVEIKEEMRALYCAEEIDNIISCLQGFKAKFTYKEIVERAKLLYPNSTFASKPFDVLRDIYRIGVIGNSVDSGVSTRWSYKEQYTFLIEEPWEIVVHPALHIELSISSRIDRRWKRNNNRKKETQKYSVKIKKILYKSIIVEFLKEGTLEEGYISMYNLGISDIEAGTLDQLFSVGEIITASIKGYNNTYSNWNMKIANNR